MSCEEKKFNHDLSLVIPVKYFNGLDVDSFDPVVAEAVSLPSLHVKEKSPKEGELVVVKDISTEGWFLSEVLRVLPNLVEVRYFTTPRLCEFCFRRTWHVRSETYVGRATYKPPYPNNGICKSGKDSLTTPI